MAASSLRHGAGHVDRRLQRGGDHLTHFLGAILRVEVRIKWTGIPGCNHIQQASNAFR